MDLWDSKGLVGLAFVNLHIKCPIFSAKNDEVLKSPMAQQLLEEFTRDCTRSKMWQVSLTLGGDACIWDELINPVGNELEQSAIFFAEISLNWTKYKNFLKGGDCLSLTRQLLLSTPIFLG